MSIFASLKKDSVMMNVETLLIIKAKEDKRNVAEMEKLYGSNKQAGIAFLNVKSQEGVVETASGLQYRS